jgi:hypothetical protein
MIDTKTFALAGNATFTVTSNRTQTRFTYKIRQPKPHSPHFVKVLTGPDNNSDYRFFGTIFPDGNFRTSGKGGLSPTNPSVQAFTWFWNQLNTPPKFSKIHRVTVNHAGKCCRCGRLLTVPQSIIDGFGPECAKYMGL